VGLLRLWNPERGETDDVPADLPDCDKPSCRKYRVEQVQQDLRSAAMKAALKLGIEILN
jgi:hypothetical protein